MTVMIVPMIYRQRVESWERFAQAAVTQLLHERPYMIGWFQRVEPVLTNGLPTLGVRIMDNGKVECLINDTWFLKLPLVEQCAVLVHELYHLVLKHLERIEQRDRERWNFATDMAINPAIPHLPLCGMDKHRGLRPDMYGWPENMRAEEYYELLVRRERTMEKNDKKGAFWKDWRVVVQEKGHKPGRRQLGSVCMDLYGRVYKKKRANALMNKQRVLRELYTYPPGDPLGQQKDGEEIIVVMGGGGGGGKPGEGQDGKGKKITVVTVDDHGQWGEKDQQPKEGKGGKAKPGEGEGQGEPKPASHHDAMVQQVAEELLDAMANAIEEGQQNQGSSWGRQSFKDDQYGNMPGELAELIKAIPNKWKLNWRQLLQGVSSAANASSYVPKWKRTKLDRRFKQRPGMVIRPKGRVYVGVDTSGSHCDAQTQGEIHAEIMKLGRHAKITISECDTRIRQTYPYRGQFPSMRGGGGTDFNPFFEQIYKMRRAGFERAVIFTDGFGPVTRTWGKRIGIPVLWVITPGGSFQAPFGRVTSINDVG